MLLHEMAHIVVENRDFFTLFRFNLTLTIKQERYLLNNNESKLFYAPNASAAKR